ncbi:MAG TPA: hypothetical protein VGB82_17525 [Alphaproteobacteria bacterium]
MTAFTRTLLILLCLLVVATGGFIIFLGVRDIPAPTARIEKVIPNERFSR